MSEKTKASDEANKGEKYESEQDARIALLGHYSSKSTNEAIILLTEAFVFFTLIGLIPSNILRDYLVIAASGTFLYLGSYAFGKLIYWGGHATAVVLVKMTDESEVEKYLGTQRSAFVSKVGKGIDKLGLPKPIELDRKNKDLVFTLDLSPTNLNRLSFACASYFFAQKERGDIFVRASYLFHSLKWMLIVFASTAVALIITLIIRYYY